MAGKLHTAAQPPVFGVHTRTPMHSQGRAFEFWAHCGVHAANMCTRVSIMLEFIMSCYSSNALRREFWSCICRLGISELSRFVRTCATLHKDQHTARLFLSKKYHVLVRFQCLCVCLLCGCIIGPCMCVCVWIYLYRIRSAKLLKTLVCMNFAA